MERVSGREDSAEERETNGDGFGRLGMRDVGSIGVGSVRLHDGVQLESASPLLRDNSRDQRLVLEKRTETRRWLTSGFHSGSSNTRYRMKLILLVPITSS